MKKKKIVLIIVLSILILISGTYLGINLYIDSLLNKIDRGDTIEIDDASIDEEVIENIEDDGTHKVFNFALFGLDKDAGDSLDKGRRSDAMKVISLDYTDKKIYISSIERDVVAYFPGDYNEYGHYNWAYRYGGPTLAIQTLNYNLDLDIVNYVSLSMQGLIDIVDTVGGVDIDLTSAEVTELKRKLREYDSAKADEISLSVGTNHLDGETALAYARIRYIDTDYVRMERQNNIIKEVIKKISSESFTEILNTVNVILPYVETNFTNSEIKSYLTDLLQFDLSNIETYKMPSGGMADTTSCPGLGGYLLYSYTDQVVELHKNIYKVDDYTCSSTVIDNEIRTYETYGKPE